MQIAANTLPLTIHGVRRPNRQYEWSEPTAMHAFSRNVMMAPAMTSSAKSVTRLIPDKRLTVCGMSTVLNAAIGADSSIEPSAKPGNEPVGLRLRSAWCRQARSSGRAGRGTTIRGSAQPRQDARPRLAGLHLPCDARGLGFRTLVGRLRNTRILLHGQGAWPPSLRSGFSHNRGRSSMPGRMNTCPGSGCGRIECSRYSDCLRSYSCFSWLIAFSFLSRFSLLRFHACPTRYDRHIRKSPERIASAHSGDSSTQLTIPTRAATAVRPTDRVRDRKVERNRKAVRNRKKIRNRKKFSVRRRQADWRSDHPNGGLPRNPPIPTWRPA